MLIEIDGLLDLITAYAVRSEVDDALEEGAHHIGLELTRVYQVDPDCARLMADCLAEAECRQVELRLVALSTPLRDSSARAGLGGIPLAAAR